MFNEALPPNGVPIPNWLNPLILKRTGCVTGTVTLNAVSSVVVRKLTASTNTTIIIIDAIKPPTKNGISDFFFFKIFLNVVNDTVV